MSKAKYRAVPIEQWPIEDVFARLAELAPDRWAEPEAPSLADLEARIAVLRAEIEKAKGVRQ